MRHNIPNVESSRGIPRYQRAVRDQMKIEMRALDQLLPSDHAARVEWEFVRKLDLSEFYEDIKAAEGRPGQPPVDPAILLALWLLATIEGVGSARELSRLCTTHPAYEWLCGEVGVNHHLLSDFRSAHPERLEKLLVLPLIAQDRLSLGVRHLQHEAADGRIQRLSHFREHFLLMLAHADVEPRWFFGVTVGMKSSSEEWRAHSVLALLGRATRVRPKPPIT